MRETIQRPCSITKSTKLFCLVYLICAHTSVSCFRAHQLYSTKSTSLSSIECKGQIGLRHHWNLPSTLKSIESSHQSVFKNRFYRKYLLNSMDCNIPSCLVVRLYNGDKFEIEKDAIVTITNLSPEKAANMGIRDWPQQVRSGYWTEKVKEDQTIVRYILDGNVNLSYSAPGKKNKEKQKIVPGTLVEVTGKHNLVWETEGESNEIILLTPTYEEVGKLAVTAILLISLCIALISGLGG